MRFASKLLVAALCCVARGAGIWLQQITGAGSTFVYPILSKWSEAYSKLNGRAGQLPVDRLGRRHRPDQGGDGRFRRVRRAAAA